ncbi:unnamed protein product [Ectocarpus sp. 13 AM-2016]
MRGFYPTKSVTLFLGLPRGHHYPFEGQSEFLTQARRILWQVYRRCWVEFRWREQQYTWQDLGEKRNLTQDFRSPTRSQRKIVRGITQPRSEVDPETKFPTRS